MDKSGCTIAWVKSEIFLGNKVKTLVAQWATVFFWYGMEHYSNTTKCQSWAITLRSMVVQWTTGSKNDLPIPVKC